MFGRTIESSLLTAICKFSVSDGFFSQLITLLEMIYWPLQLYVLTNIIKYLTPAPFYIRFCSFGILSFPFLNSEYTSRL